MHENNIVQIYVDSVTSSSNENKVSIKLLYSNSLYKNVAAILRQELELYVKTLYILNQDVHTKIDF